MHIYPERIFPDKLNRKDDKGCRKAVWPPEKSFALLEPKPAGYDLQEYGEIQYGICLICMNGSFRNIVSPTWCHPEANCQNYSCARCFSEQECHTTTSTKEKNWFTHLVPLDIPWRCTKLPNSMLPPLPEVRRATRASTSHGNSTLEHCWPQEDILTNCLPPLE